MQPTFGSGPRDANRTETGPKGANRHRLGANHSPKAAHKVPESILCTNGDSGPRRRPCRGRRAPFWGWFWAVLGPGPAPAETVPFGPAEARKTRAAGRQRAPTLIPRPFLGATEPPTGRFRSPEILVLAAAYFGAGCGPNPFHPERLPEAHRGRKTRVPCFGAKGDPKGGYRASPDPSGEPRNPNREFSFLGVSVLVAGARFAAAAGRAGSAHWPNDRIDQRKSFGLQLGAPHPYP